MKNTEVQSRYPVKGKHLALALLLLMGISLISLLTIIRVKTTFSQRIHPFLAHNQSFYVWFSPKNQQKDDLVLTLDLFLPFLGENQPKAQEWLHLLQPQWNTPFGLFMDDSGLYLAFIDAECKQEDRLQQLFSPENYAYTQFSLANQCYLIIGEQEWGGILAEHSTDLLSDRYKLWSLEQKEEAFFVFRSRIPGEQLYGIAQNQENQFVLRLGKTIEDFFPELDSIQVPESLFTIEQDNKKNEVHSPNFGGILSFQHLLYSAGRFSLFSGALTEFMENPYQEGLQWLWEGNEDDALQFQAKILSDLAKQFPLAEERTLPDDSIIFELREDPKPFLSTQVTEEGKERLLITYPEGQIIQEEREGMITIQKEIPQEEMRFIDHSCLFPESTAYGAIDSTFFDTELWKSIQFSYDQQKMILCIHKNT